MASYPVAADELAAYGKVAVATQIDTVTFDRECGSVRVTNDTGVAAIFFTVDGSDPAVNGAKSYRVPALAGAYTDVEVPGSDGPDTIVKLISAGAVTYSVEGSR